MRMEISVAKLQGDQIEGAAELLAQAFNDQPFGRFWEPDPKRRMLILHERFLRFVRYCYTLGEPYVTADELAGVALWMPPHATQITVEQEREFGLDELPEIFGEEAFARYRPLRDLLNELHGRDMRGPHWYLPIIGVDPSRQGTGVGSALLRTGLARADEWRLPCYLDTGQPRNVPFYERHGFNIFTHGVEPVSTLPYWTFRRNPVTTWNRFSRSCG
jgi:GNAT superfamily N-acetyltransferase